MIIKYWQEDWLMFTSCILLHVFSYYLSAFAGYGSSFPIFFVQLADNNKGKFFLCKEQNNGIKQQDLSGNSNTGLMSEVSGPKRKAKSMDEDV